jgi:hypothetical protein
MKKIVFKVEEVVANIKEINNKSFVGILWKDKDKSIVVRLPNDDFTCLHNSNPVITSIAAQRSTKNELVNDIAKSDNYFVEAFVFETYKELLTWFAK